MRFITVKKEQTNSSKCSGFASFALLHLFFISNSVVFGGDGRKNISCPRTHGTLATTLLGENTCPFQPALKSSAPGLIILMFVVENDD